MAKPKVQIFRDKDGNFAWRLLNADGSVAEIRTGSVPGLTNKPGKPALRDAVQAGLRALYERQEAGAR